MKKIYMLILILHSIANCKTRTPSLEKYILIEKEYHTLILDAIQIHNMSLENRNINETD